MTADAMAPAVKRVRAYFAPVNRTAKQPTVFDPAQSGSFALDAVARLASFGDVAAGDDYRRAFARQLQRGTVADAAVAAGNDGGLAGLIRNIGGGEMLGHRTNLDAQ